MPVETEYRVLVPDAHVGSIIGHNGDLIRKNRAETGASVKVFSSTQGDSLVLICKHKTLLRSGSLAVGAP